MSVQWFFSRICCQSCVADEQLDLETVLSLVLYILISNGLHILQRETAGKRAQSSTLLCVYEEALRMQLGRVLIL